MAVPFSNTKLRVPHGFQNILEGLAREVLRNQPQDIYAFGAVYFDNLLKLRNEGGAVDPAKHGAQMEDRFYNNKSFQKPDIDPSNNEQQDAALKIQTKYRQHHAKQVVNEKRREMAAVKIQAGARGMQDRKLVKEISDGNQASGEDAAPTPPPDATEEEIAEAKRKAEEAAANEEEEIDIDLNDPEVANAATKIQAGFRGHKARKEVKASKPSNQDDNPIKSTSTDTNKDPPEEEIDIDLNDPEVADAAMKIQAKFRGKKFGFKKRSTQISASNIQVELGQYDKKLDTQNTDSFEGVCDKSQPGRESVDKSTVPKVNLNDCAGEKDKAKEHVEGENSGNQQRPSSSADEEVDIDLNDPDVAHAASLIQNKFRGKVGRKGFGKRTSHEEVIKRPEEPQDVMDGCRGLSGRASQEEVTKRPQEPQDVMDGCRGLSGKASQEEVTKRPQGFLEGRQGFVKRTYSEDTTDKGMKAPHPRKDARSSWVARQVKSFEAQSFKNDNVAPPRRSFKKMNTAGKHSSPISGTKQTVTKRVSFSEKADTMSCVLPAANQNEEEIDIDLDDPDVAAAACKIQAKFRGRNSVFGKKKGVSLV